MAKSKNHTAHNQGHKNHRNGIKKAKRYRTPSMKGVDPKFLRNLKYVRKGNIKAVREKRRAAAKESQYIKGFKTCSGSTPDIEESFLRLVKDRLKILFQREDDPLSIDYHLQSTDDQTNFLGRNDSGFTPLIASPRSGQRIIWRFVYYETPGIAGVFYISSEGTFWHFNNLQSNENVELLSVNGDPSFAEDPSNLFIIVNSDAPRYIQPYFHQEWYVQFNPFVIQAILPVTNSVTAPYIGFNVTPVHEGFIKNCPQAADIMDENAFLREVKENLMAFFEREDDPLHIDYNLQSTDDTEHFLGHDGSNCFTPLIASSPNVESIRWRYVYYPTPGLGGVFYTSSRRPRTFWHFNNLRRNGNVGLVTGDAKFARDQSNVFNIVNPVTPRYIQHQQWYVQFAPPMIQPTLPATRSKTAPHIGFNVTPV